MLKPSLLIALLSLGTVLQGAQPTSKKQQSESCAPGPRYMRAAVRHIEAGGVGYNKGYSTLEAFIASDPNQWCVIPFLDLRGHVFNDGKMAANAGIGARSMWGCRAYGINTYYDYRNTHHRGYNQVSLGLETLGELWDLRLNGYLPVGGKVSAPYNIDFAGFSGNSILVNRKFQYAMKGIDGEVGFHFGKTSDFDFYGAAGPYYFKGEMGKGAIGGKLRLAGYYKEYVTLELSDSFDNVFHNNVQGQLTLTLPFGPKSKPKATGKNCPKTCDFATTMTTRMLQPVARQEIIVVDTHTKKEATSNFVIFVDNESHSAGTFESPYPTLSDAETNSNPGDIIYVLPGDGSTTGMNVGITLQNDQKFWGSGVGHYLSTNFGTIYIPPMTSTSPQITNGSATAITLALNNEVSGFTISGPGGNGIYGNNQTDVSVQSCLISNSGNNGIELYFTEGVSNVTIDKVTINESLNLGIYIEGDSTASINVLVTNSSLADNGNSPIDIETYDNSFVNATINNNIISSNRTGIVLLCDSVTSSSHIYSLNQNLVQTTIEGPGINLLVQNTTPVQLQGTYNQFLNNSNASQFNLNGGGNATLYLTNSQFDGTNSDNGFYINCNSGSNVNATIVNNTFNDSAGVGFYGFVDSAVLCVQMEGNSSNTGYQLTQNSGTFNIGPCNAEAINSGGLYDNVMGTITHVEFCPSGAICSP